MTCGSASDLDVLLSVLSNRRARFVSYYVESGDVTEINELYLAREVAAWETGIDPSQVPTETVTSVLSELQDETLPGLNEAGLVEFDPGRGTVRYGNPPKPFDELLQLCRSTEQHE